MTLESTIAREEAAFDKTFILENSDRTKSGKQLACDPGFAKNFLRESITRAIREAFEATGVEEEFIKKRYGIVEEEGQEGKMCWNAALAASKERQSAYLGDV